MQPSSAGWHSKSRYDASYLPMPKQLPGHPEGAFLPDAQCEGDHVVVIYPHGHCPPKITVQVTSEDVQTVLADGLAVAVVACVNGPNLCPADVVLVERYAGA